MARNREYRKLRGRGRGVATYHTLWLGPGHLLMVESSGYREIYTRIDLGDVQSIVIRRTNTMFVRAGITAFVLFLLGSAMVLAPSEFRIFWGILAVLTSAVLLFDLLFGPTCSAELRTPIQNLRLHSLRRVRVAQKVVSTLRPLIEQAQGSVSEEQIRQGYSDVAPLPKVAPPVLSTGRPERQGSTSPVLHTVLAALLLIEIPLSLTQGAFESNTWLSAAGMLMFLAEVGVALAAAIRQGKRGPSKGHRVWVWVTLAYLVFAMVGGMIYGVVLGFNSIVDGGSVESGIAWVSGVYAIGVSGLLAFWVVLELRRRRAGGGA
jgi:hypothetical protein